MSAIWPLDIHTVNMSIFGYDTMIYRNDGTMCASYYAAFQNLMYPSSEIFSKESFQYTNLDGFLRLCKMCKI